MIPPLIVDLCRAMLQTLLYLLIVTTPLLLCGVLAATRLRRIGRVIAACTSLRLTLLFVTGLSVLVPLTRLHAWDEEAAIHDPIPAYSSPRQTLPQVRLHPDTSALVQITPAASGEKGISPYWFIGAAVLWSTVSTILLLGLTASHLYIQWLRRTSITDTAAAAIEMSSLIEHTPQMRRPEVRLHQRVGVPFAACFPFASPAVFLPAKYETQFHQKLLRDILTHEVSHIRRGDHRWNLLSRVVCCLLWIQPLSWLMLFQLEAAQEIACDIEAIGGAGQADVAAAYASSLLDIATILRSQSSPNQQRSMRVVGMPIISSRIALEERIRHLMNARDIENVKRALSLRARIALVSGTTLTASASMALLTGLAPAFSLPTAAPPSANAGKTDASIAARTSITMDLRNSTLREGLERICQAAGWKLAVAPEAEQAVNTAPLTIKMTEYPAPEATLLAVRNAGSPIPLAAHWDGDTVHISVVPLDTENLPVKTVTLDYSRDTPLSTVLDDLFAGTGARYELERIDRTAPVRIQVTDVPFKQALQTLLARVRPTPAYKGDRTALVRIVSSQPIPPPID